VPAAKRAAFVLYHMVGVCGPVLYCVLRVVECSCFEGKPGNCRVSFWRRVLHCISGMVVTELLSQGATHPSSSELRCAVGAVECFSITAELMML